MKSRRRRGGKQRKWTAVSLFSGAMGLDLGLEKAGLDLRVAVECDRIAVETIRKNKPKLPVIPLPVEHVSSKRLLQEAGLRRGEVDLVVGGPCCQPFSTAGARASVEEKDGGLFKSFTRIIRDLRPRLFVMENVPGIMSAAIVHRPLAKRGPGHPLLKKEERLGSAFRVMLLKLRSLGYYVIWGVLNAADFGVPQARRRVIFIGSRDGEPIDMPTSTHDRKGSQGRKRWVSLREALRDLDDPEGLCGRIPPKWSKFMKYVPAGGAWRHIPPRHLRDAMGKALRSWGGRNGFYRRLSWSAPSPSLTTRPTSKATLLCHPTATRPLSVREYARIQQFPDHWKFEGSVPQQYRQIGNAVPVGLGRAIGERLVELLAGPVVRRPSLKGVVKCVDPELEKRLGNRPMTVLNPPRMRLSAKVDSLRRWLKSSGRVTRAKVIGFHATNGLAHRVNSRITIRRRKETTRV